MCLKLNSASPARLARRLPPDEIPRLEHRKRLIGFIQPPNVTQHVAPEGLSDHRGGQERRTSMLGDGVDSRYVASLTVTGRASLFAALRHGRGEAPRGRAGFPRQPGRDGEGSTVSPAASRRYPAKNRLRRLHRRADRERSSSGRARCPIPRESRSSARAGATNSTGASRVKVARYSSRSSSLACAQWMSSNTSKVGRASAVASANRRAARRPG